ncbi:hypothetical protein SLE2022_289600 [Rubroshorea leprosula]
MINDRDNKSLYEESLKMAVGIIKLSSFSIAKMSLGPSGPPTGTENPAAALDSASDKPPLRQSARSQKSEKLQSSSKPVLMQPAGGENEGSISILHMMHESDETFSDYIRRVREKYKNDFS